MPRNIGGAVVHLAQPVPLPAIDGAHARSDRGGALRTLGAPARRAILRSLVSYAIIRRLISLKGQAAHTGP